MFCVGHAVICDFNAACIVRPDIPICALSGTKPYMGNVIPHYIKSFVMLMPPLAPEMLVPPPWGYTYTVDWWSLGVTAYQLLKGQV